MNITLPYGTNQIPIDVPDNWINGRCYRPHAIEPCADSDAELMAAIAGLPQEKSLQALANGKNECVIAVDGYNLSAMKDLLPALINLIEDETHLSADQISIVVSNNFISPLENDAAEKLISPLVLDHYRVSLHDPRRARSVIKAGHLANAGFDVSVNRHYLEADFRIILGGVRPTLLEGFTGGRHVILPGLADVDTLKSLYTPDRVQDPNARFGNYLKNPFHLAGMECLNAVGCDLAVAVPLTYDQKPAAVYVGHYGQTQLAAMDFLRNKNLVPVREPMDIVVTSCGGSPYDDTLVQLVNTLSAVESVLTPDGTIVVSAALGQGHGPMEFSHIIKQTENLKETMEWLAQNERLIPGQWVAERLYQILQRHEVILFNTEWEEDAIWQMGFTPTRDMNEAILGAMESHGQRCKIVALPSGPQGIAEISDR